MHHGLNDLRALAFSVRSWSLARRHQLHCFWKTCQYSDCKYLDYFSDFLFDRKASLRLSRFAIGNFDEIAIGIPDVNGQQLGGCSCAFNRAEIHFNAMCAEVSNQCVYRYGT